MFTRIPVWIPFGLHSRSFLWNSSTGCLLEFSQQLFTESLKGLSWNYPVDFLLDFLFEICKFSVKILTGILSGFFEEFFFSFILKSFEEFLFKVFQAFFFKIVQEKSYGTSISIYPGIRYENLPEIFLEIFTSEIFSDFPQYFIGFLPLSFGYFRNINRIISQNYLKDSIIDSSRIFQGF